MQVHALIITFRFGYFNSARDLLISYEKLIYS